MSKHKYTKDQKTTRNVIDSMLKQNTGRHLLGSGDAYGRNNPHCLAVSQAERLARELAQHEKNNGLHYDIREG